MPADTINDFHISTRLVCIGQQDERPVRMLHHPLGHRAEKAGEAQVGDHDHHAEQQDDGVEIDGGDCLL
jgi:hypothetical protein